MYLYPLIAWPLHWASVLFPGVAWFSVLQTVFLWLANTVVIKSIWQCFARADRPDWQAALASVGFLLLFAVRADTRVTYTITAAMMGGAAVAHMMSIDAVKTPLRPYLCRVLGGFALFLAAASLRNNTALPIIGFLGITLVLHALQRWPQQAARTAWRAALRPQMLALAGLALLYGLLEGGRALDVILQGEQTNVQWQLARTSVTDYLRMLSPWATRSTSASVSPPRLPISANIAARQRAVAAASCTARCAFFSDTPSSLQPAPSL